VVQAVQKGHHSTLFEQDVLLACIRWTCALPCLFGQQEGLKEEATLRILAVPHITQKDRRDQQKQLALPRQTPRCLRSLIDSE